MTLRTLIELRDYHLNEAMRPRGSCDLTAFAQAKWHLEVANQLMDFAEAMIKAFPALKYHLETITDCARSEQTGHGVLVG